MIEIFCLDCQKSYSMATANTEAVYDKRTGAVKIITRCPRCREESMAMARSFDTITTKERSAAATKPGSFDAIE